MELVDKKRQTSVRVHKQSNQRKLKIHGPIILLDHHYQEHLM